MTRKYSVCTAICLGLILSAVSSAISYADEPALSFQDRVTQEAEMPLQINQHQQNEIDSVQFIFVDGIFGDFWKSNFDPSIAVLQSEWGVQSFDVIRPKSTNTIFENAEILYQQILDLRQASPKKKAILVSHSKGGAETALMILRHPDLVTHYGLEKAAFVSAPIAGTPIIDFVEAGCNDTDFLCQYLNSRLPALRTFVPSEIQPLFANALASLSDHDRGILSTRLFYVQTQMSDTNVLSTLWFPHLFLNLFYSSLGSNDGLIPTQNEMLRGPDGQIFGVNLGTFTGDHNSLLQDSSNDQSLAFRKAFFRSLAERLILNQ